MNKLKSESTFLICEQFGEAVDGRGGVGDVREVMDGSRSARGACVGRTWT